MKNLKKYFYIFSFSFLGLLVSFIIHSVVEIWYIGRLVSDFGTWGLGLTWQSWYIIHHVLSVLLAIGGLACGWAAGNYWWRVLYVEKRYNKHFWRKE
ncbi:MAG TPA: hypothetical protein VJK50_05330 [Patescibacteria group bacterium]|nr:hypothetical protein [Patescibacteria group bacterium]